MSKDIERSVKERLKTIAKEENRTANDVWKTLGLERFLARLSRSPHCDHLIFKGGILLSKYINLGRETIDLDFLLTNLESNVDSVRKAISEILNVELEDGFIFSDLEVSELDQLHMNYPGYTVTAKGSLGDAEVHISLDVGVGDTVDKTELKIDLLATQTKPLFEPSITLKVYPVEFIFAEKLETAISRGVTNSRMKDFSDLWLMLEENILDIEKAKSAISKTFSNRGTALQYLLPIFQNNTGNLEASWRNFQRLLQEEVRNRIPKNPLVILERIDSWLKTNGLID